VDHTCRLVTTAGVSLPTFFTGLLLAYVFYYVLGWAPSPMGRLDPYLTAPPAVTGLYTVDSLIAGEPRLFLASAKQMILPALTLGIFRAGAAGTHDARRDAGRAVGRLRAHRPRVGPVVGPPCWCATPSQCAAAGA
jgi:hypothetical protein